MINYFEQQNWENLKVNGSIKHNGKSFTGIKENINLEDNSCHRKLYVSGIDHGYSFMSYFKDDKLYVSMYIYIYGEIRFLISYYIDDNERYSFAYHLCYHLTEINFFQTYLNEGNGVNHYQKMFVKRKDLNTERLFIENKDVIDAYEEGKSYITDIDTFCQCWTGEYERFAKTIIQYLIQGSMKRCNGYVFKDTFMEKFVWQEEQIEKIIHEDRLPTDIQFIGGVTVAYHDITQKIVAVVTVMDVNSQEIVDQAIYTEDRINMHIPDVFGFNETIWAIKAFEKLAVKPQFIFCDGHGIEHPKNMGFATFLGIQLDIPTIGCAKKRLVGYYKKEDLGDKRADHIELIFDQKVVGKALRTKENTNPIYVSIGHKISLETSVNWVLETTQSTRLPFILEKAIEIARQQMPEQFRIDFMNDEPNEYGIIK
ncbi:endonuclease V [Flavobacterium davisii]|uniref:Endonuclease V n=1 Tax=Flavobacterium columnare TaxID=996 RepID=A0A8G0PAG2_9FLAO|nr:endonuclease V [Flavobacterium davisii]QYS89448.1 endonuclease V [Flavobacterium davisii]